MAVGWVQRKGSAVDAPLAGAPADPDATDDGRRTTDITDPSTQRGSARRHPHPNAPAKPFTPFDAAAGFRNAESRFQNPENSTLVRARCDHNAKTVVAPPVVRVAPDPRPGANICAGAATIPPTTAPRHVRLTSCKIFHLGGALRRIHRETARRRLPDV